MGLTYVSGVVIGPTGQRRSLEFLVDSGAKYTLLPEADWRALELAPMRSMTFVLADGTRIVRAISECRIALEFGEAHTPVILGQAGDDALLGVVTLEILGLVLNPFSRTLQPMRLAPA